ncbi:SDR family oxidoreductase [Williamsia sp. CHRR-6]|uniref:SDR family oxidoreductase n=1 Tax=Williamsia sp. CHRR-6 TaxID=2835871 RepID=UPI001BD99C52|nr:SDR family oxidoreductase [Williamsia sp. CHRR-6]MBT0567793.1 SDR family oxidoreductase [Williamsia sp. CHRR-6]
MNSHDLTGRVAVVTGGASGIGRAAVEQLARTGASVVIADLDEVAAKDAAQQVVDPDLALAVHCDVADADSVQSAVDSAVDTFGRLDILVANAGITHLPTPALDLDEEQFARVFDVNVKGVWLCARAAVPAMRAGGAGGSIVITGSVMGERTRRGFSAYAPSKAAANHLARTLAIELAPDIRVNAVAPVATDTPMLPSFLGPDDPAAARERFIAGIPLGRLATPADIAEGIVFLASDAARFITGSVLPVDGGRAL